MAERIPTAIAHGQAQRTSDGAAEDDSEERRGECPRPVPAGNPAIQETHIPGPEALRPRLTTGLPICDGGQLIGICEWIQLSAPGHSDHTHSIFRRHRIGSQGRSRRPFYDRPQWVTTNVCPSRRPRRKVTRPGRSALISSTKNFHDTTCEVSCIRKAVLRVFSSTIGRSWR